MVVAAEGLVSDRLIYSHRSSPYGRRPVQFSIPAEDVGLAHLAPNAGSLLLQGGADACWQGDGGCMLWHAN